jgi:hypothetical protein
VGKSPTWFFTKMAMTRAASENHKCAPRRIGGNKSLTIQSHQVLKWYFSEFQRHLGMGATRVMVIGYGFNDPHINNALLEPTIAEHHGRRIKTTGHGCLSRFGHVVDARARRPRCNTRMGDRNPPAVSGAQPSSRT